MPVAPHLDGLFRQAAVVGCSRKNTHLRGSTEGMWRVVFAVAIFSPLRSGFVSWCLKDVAL